MHNFSCSITVKPPFVNGIEIDLFLFYSLVQQRGGIGKVNPSQFITYAYLFIVLTT